jgi:hypothetical protein
VSIIALVCKNGLYIEMMTSLVSLIKTNLLRLIIILFSDTLGGTGVSLN